MGVWIVILLMKCAQSENYCNPESQVSRDIFIWNFPLIPLQSQNPSNTITKVFEKPTENLECTLDGDRSNIFTIKFFRCDDKSETLPLSHCTSVTQTTGQISASCSVTINEENIVQTFYCTEHRAGDLTGELSTLYNITFVPSKFNSDLHEWATFNNQFSFTTFNK